MRVLPTKLQGVFSAHPSEVVHNLVRVLLLKLGIGGTDSRVPEIAEGHIGGTNCTTWVRVELCEIGVLQTDIVDQVVSQRPGIGQRNLTVAGQQILVERGLGIVHRKQLSTLIEQK